MTKYLDNSGLERFFDNIKGLMRGPSYQQVETYLDAHPEATTTVQDRAVSTEKLGNKSVTTLKLGEKAVTTQKIDDNAVTTAKLSDGAVTDAKLATQKVNQPLFSGVPTNGTSGQVLRTLGDGTTEWATVGLPSEAQTSAALSEWLEDHPDVTTTVQDNSITLNKLSPALANSIPLTRISDAEIQQIVGEFDNKGVPSPVYAYDTVADMQADSDLTTDMIVHTNGFHTSGDGGAAYYTISASGKANDMDVLALQGGLFATLVVTEPYVAPEMLGWVNGNSADIINYAIETYDNVSMSASTYIITTPIEFNSNNKTFSCYGSIDYTGDDSAVKLKSSYNNIYINKLYSCGDGLHVEPAEASITTNCIEINLLQSKRHCLYLYANNNGIDFNHFVNGKFAACKYKWNNYEPYDYDSIHIECSGANAWLAYNTFTNIALVNGRYGFYAKSSANVTKTTLGNYFESMEFEGNRTGCIYVERIKLDKINAYFDSVPNFNGLESVNGGTISVDSTGYFYIDASKIDITTIPVMRIMRINRVYSTSGSVRNYDVLISKYGIFTQDDMCTKLISGPSWKDVTINDKPNPLNESVLCKKLHLRSADGTRTTTLPPCFGYDAYSQKLSDVFISLYVSSSGTLTIKDSSDNLVDTITFDSSNPRVCYHYVATYDGWIKVS